MKDKTKKMNLVNFKVQNFRINDPSRIFGGKKDNFTSSSAKPCCVANDNT